MHWTWKSLLTSSSFAGELSKVHKHSVMQNVVYIFQRVFWHGFPSFLYWIKTLCTLALCLSVCDDAVVWLDSHSQANCASSPELQVWCWLTGCKFFHYLGSCTLFLIIPFSVLLPKRVPTPTGNNQSSSTLPAMQQWHCWKGLN